MFDEDEKLKKELSKISLPLKFIEVDFETDKIWVKLGYEFKDDRTVATLEIQREKFDTLEMLLDEIKSVILNHGKTFDKSLT
ncbi:MAG: hypothetical protein J4F36_13135 [Nitrosopumilaceae archaeon]|nr:hypothetical protein [Nitrosopumilaceae archaeon]